MSKKKGSKTAGDKSQRVPFRIFACSKGTPAADAPETIYFNPESEKSQSQIRDYVFSTDRFRQAYAKFNNPIKRKGLRVFVQIGTIEALLRGKYFLSPTQSVVLDKKVMEKSAQQTRFYPSDAVFKAPARSYESEVNVIEGDCLDVAIALIRRGFNPAVLNMASRSHPGGGFETGAGAQEEEMFRRSALMQCLLDPYKLDPSRKWTYPLPEYGGCYSPDVLVFRGGPNDAYGFFPVPVKVAFVSVAAYSNPSIELDAKTKEQLLDKTSVTGTRKKIKAILNIALAHGHDSIVLSAFGCGAYKNPPRHMARLFLEELNGPYAGSFRAVHFAIFDDHNAHQDHNPDGNVKPFAEVFAKLIARSAKPAPAATAADTKADAKSAPDAAASTDAKDTATTAAAAEEEKYPTNYPVAGVYLAPPAAAAAAAAAMAAAVAAAAANESDAADDGNAPLSAVASSSNEPQRPKPAAVRIDPGFAAFIQTYDPKLSANIKSAAAAAAAAATAPTAAVAGTVFAAAADVATGKDHKSGASTTAAAAASASTATATAAATASAPSTTAVDGSLASARDRKPRRVRHEVGVAPVAIASASATTNSS